MRIARVLAEVDADVVALQEVDGADRAHPESQARELARGLGMAVVEAPLLLAGQSHWGNAILSRYPIGHWHRHRFARSGKEPRGLLFAEIEDDVGTIWRIATTHLDLMPHHRTAQLRETAAILAAEPPLPTVLVGDLNAWRRRSRALSALGAAVDLLDSPPTFPSRWPWLRLDRIAIRGCRLVGTVTIVDTAAARAASDHLPLLAELAAAPQPAAARSRAMPSSTSSEPLQPISESPTGIPL